ncbi:MAG: PTS transporter subunit EIIA [Gammaproteobacteria bacterium]|nr:PTS transporter subunit EIIA [Gammaproteobacteria bacterium]
MPQALPNSTSVTLDGILDPERIVCGIVARSKKHALDILSEVLSGGERPLHKLDVFDNLMQRERLGSTAIGHGIAIPHARIENLLQIRAGFVRLDEPVDFDAADGKPVHMMLGLLVPHGNEEQHLALLSTIATMLGDGQYRDSLESAADPDELYDLLTEVELPGSDETGSS